MPVTIEPTKKSVLILGATGRTGKEIISSLAHHQSHPEVHAFCRDVSKLSTKDTNLCTSVVQGDARSEADIEKALRKTNATVVVVSVGNGDSVKASDIRTVSAQILAKCMQKPEFQHVRAMVISSSGAGSSKIVVGMGIGTMISFHLRHVLKDHNGQELAFAAPELKERTCIVRPTSLKDGKATGKVVYFGDQERAPTIETDRADVAVWVAEEISAKNIGGTIVNITGAKK